MVEIVNKGDTRKNLKWFPGHMKTALEDIEENKIKLADAILYVLDARAPFSCMNPNVNKIVHNKPIIYVFNKCDLADEKRIAVVFNKIDRIDRERDAVLLSRLNGLFPQAVYVSAATGEGMDDLLATLSALSSNDRKLLSAVITPDRYDLIAFARANAQIYSEEYTEGGALKIVFAIEDKYRNKYTDYLI